MRRCDAMHAMHDEAMHDEAMRWTMRRCDAVDDDDGAMLWGDAMHDEAMRCTMRRCDER